MMKTAVYAVVERDLLSDVMRQACEAIGAVNDAIRSKIANRILSMARDGEINFETRRSHATWGLASTKR